MKLKIGNKIFKYFPLAVVGRNSVLFLARVNAFRLANAMYQAAKDKDSKAWRELAAFWEKSGGKPADLRSAIKKGIAIEFKHHPNKHKGEQIAFNYDPEGIDDMEADNFEPVTTGTAAATGAPLITKILSILAKAGISTEDVKKGLTSLGKKGFDELMKQKGNKTTNNADGTQTIEIATPTNIPNLEKNTPVMALTVIAVVVLGIIVTTGKK